MLEPTINLQTPRWAKPLLQPKRYKGAKGGRGGGKSHFFAEMALETMISNPSANVVCIREIQKSIKFSVKKLVEDKIRELNIIHLFEITQAEIRRINGNGVMIFQGMQDHTADSIKSLEAFDVAWVEEAQSISERSLELLLPTIRADGSEIWFSWNPFTPEDAIERFFSKPSNEKILVTVNYLDNPFANEVIFNEAERHKVERPDTFDNVWLGEYARSGLVFKRDSFKVISQDTYDSIINQSFENDDWCLDEGVNPSEIITYMSVDVAVTDTKTSDNSAITIGTIDQNNDKYVLAQHYGRWLSDELLNRVFKYARDNNVQYIGIEDSAVSKTFIENLESAINLRNLPYVIIRLKPQGRNKVARVQQYILSAINANKLYFVERISEDFINEAINFPEGLHDDIIDSLAWFIEMGTTLLQQMGGQQSEVYYTGKSAPMGAW